MTFVLPDPVLKATSILIAGCGGGYDVFAGLPIYFYLTRRLGKTCHLANYSFTVRRTLEEAGSELIGPHCFKVKRGDQCDPENTYFPELQLSRALFEESGGLEVPVFTYGVEAMFAGTIQGLRSFYGAVQADTRFDCLLVVDAGTDSLMTGDEPERGTWFEDISTLLAVKHFECPKFLVTVGFNIDAAHDVTDASFLRAVAALSAQGAFLGGFFLTKSQDFTQRFLAVFDKCTPSRSIVNSLIVAAINGVVGNVTPAHLKDRLGAEGNKLFISPLMAMLWLFDFDAVVDRLKYVTDDSVSVPTLLSERKLKTHE
jgi:hypothetical protein